MSEVTANIFLGRLWVDYGPDIPWVLGPRITFLNRDANVILSAVSVWITLWSPGYWALIKLVVKEIGLHRFYDVIKETHTAEECTWETFCLLCASLWAWKLGNISFRRIVLLFPSGGIFIALSVGAVSAGYLALDSSGTSRSAGCSLWAPDPRVNDSARPSTVIPVGNIVSNAESLYEECYESDPEQQSCPIFTENVLPNMVTVNNSCPFTNSSMCLLGSESAILFDTDYTPATDVGVNVPPQLAPSFRAYMSCAPVVLDGFFIEVNTTGEITTIYFFYGPRSNDTSTFNQTRSLYYEAIFSPTGIELKVTSERQLDFKPIPGMQGRNLNEHTSLLFIDIFNIRYASPNSDPIFGATTPVPCPTDPTIICYQTNQLPAHVLGCIESAVLCPPGAISATRCLDIYSYTNITAMFAGVQVWANQTGTDLGAAWLLAQGLFYADVASTVATRHGLILNATAGIDGNRESQALSPQQWQLETRRLFEIALVRAKMEMLAVVTGMRAGWEGYVDVARLWFPGVDTATEVCPKFRFVGQGVTDITFVGFLVAIFVPLIVGAWSQEMVALCWIWLHLGRIFGFLFGRKRRAESRRRSTDESITSFSTVSETGTELERTEPGAAGEEAENVNTAAEAVDAEAGATDTDTDKA